MSHNQYLDHISVKQDLHNTFLWSLTQITCNWQETIMLVFKKSGFWGSVAFSFDDDSDSIGSPYLNLSFRIRIACSKSFRTKLIAQFPMKRQANQVCSDFDGKSGFLFLVVFSSDGDSGSIESPYLNLSFRTRIACSKSFEIKLLAQFPFKRQRISLTYHLHIQFSCSIRSLLYSHKPSLPNLIWFLGISD